MIKGLFQRGFLSLVVTQFFGAANDNIIKQVLTFMVIAGGIWEDQLGEGSQGVVAVCFTLPFLVFSGYAGQISDRFSKRNVLLGVKIAEIPIAIVALIGFWMGSLWITMTALVLLTCQSSFFGPAKYGVIPELVDDGDLSRANGLINMMTNIAVITGTVAAGFIADRYAPKQLESEPVLDPLMWLPGVVMIGVAVLGLLAVLFMPKLPAREPGLKYDLNPFGTYFDALGEMSRGPLLVAALTWGYFYLLAGLSLLIIPEYDTVLGIERSDAALLMAYMAVAIAVGCVFAGWISGHQIRLVLVPIGAVGVTVFMILLGLLRPSYYLVAGLLVGAGFFAGFYLIPLQAMLQKLSPEDERGRYLGTANAISFTFLAASGAVVFAIRDWFGDQPQRMFLVSACLMLLGGGSLIWRVFRTMRQLEERRSSKRSEST